MSLLDLECPGDTITYWCSIVSEIDDLHLIWDIMLPGETRHIIHYNSTSPLNAVATVDMYNISSTLVNYTRGHFIASSIEVVLLPGVPMSGTVLGCGIQVDGIVTEQVTEELLARDDGKVKYSV